MNIVAVPGKADWVPAGDATWRNARWERVEGDGRGGKVEYSGRTAAQRETESGFFL